MDLEVIVKDSGFDGLQSGASLAAGQCDLVASAMTITEEREANLDFSDPYYDSKQSLLANVDSGIASIEDLAGKKVGIQQGTTGAAYAQENVPEGTELVAFPSDAELYASIESGGVDAVLQDLPVNLQHTQEGSYEIVEEYDTAESYGLAVKEEGSEDLLDEVNAQLQTLRDNGEYDQIYDKYFSTD
jgi:polar amino acid transport system substrate-binding protein